MPKKNWTAEERQAFAEKMRAARAKKLAIETPGIEEFKIAEAAFLAEQAPSITLTQDQFQAMLDRIENLERKKEGTQTQLNAQGNVVGVIERYSVDPRHYQSPIEALYDLPQLKRYAMRENYEIRWEVHPTKYQTSSGTWFLEPRFELTLLRRMFDEDDPSSELPTKIVLGKASFFEDPPANILEAEQAGVALDDLDKGEFQEKMRMWRYAFWLNERLNPRRPDTTKFRTTQQVIGGKVYEIENSTKPYEG